MKTWLITGASSGLGQIMTERLLNRGDKVFATVRREHALHELAAKYPGQLTAVVVDLTDVETMRSKIDAVFASGRVDFVVSNAGYGLFGAIEEASDAQIERQIGTNLLGSIHFIRATLPHLRKQGGGRIIQVSSEGGQTTYPGFGYYHASKWGIEGFVETLAQEVAAFGIDCMIVEPGPTGTGFATNLDLAEPIPDYDASPVGETRRGFSDGSFEVKGDAERSVELLIDTAVSDILPLRLALGSAAYERISTSLERRLAEVRKQRETAYAADRIR
jgi:NAD(P)-dependent dehydrogenase (short-subunit alcohol dehydrogenase family)